jgi:hypothetical protein
MAVNLETKFPISVNQQLKIDLSNNWKFVVNSIQVHICYIRSFFYVDLIVFPLVLRLSLQIRCFRWFNSFVRSDKFVLE